MLHKCTKCGHSFESAADPEDALCPRCYPGMTKEEFDEWVKSLPSGDDLPKSDTTWESL